MPCVMPASFSLGFSGAAMLHCDTGGFFSFGKMHRDDEVFTRWLEMCAFSLLMRSHESIRPWANSQPDSPGVLPYTVKLTGVHTALAPYLKHVRETASQGIAVMRPDFWEKMDYAESRDEYSYFLGDDLFVCPVIERRATRRTVFLPEGEWVHFWSGREYSGGKHVVDAPLGKIPVFWRKGSSFEEVFRAAAEA